MSLFNKEEFDEFNATMEASIGDTLGISADASEVDMHGFAALDLPYVIVNMATADSPLPPVKYLFLFLPHFCVYIKFWIEPPTVFIRLSLRLRLVSRRKKTLYHSFSSFFKENGSYLFTTQNRLNFFHQFLFLDLTFNS